jgi:nitric oxide dioxygenase
MISTQDIQIVKSTIPLLVEGGTAITEHFYNRMFKHNPELKNVFNMSNQKSGRQNSALFDAILSYATYIDNLSMLKHAVERIAQKHTSLNIKPADYDIVGHHLIETFRELLPTQFTQEVEHSWGKAYGVLAGIFIGREEELYQHRENSVGGWRGKRAFSIVDKVQESELVTSFVFEPLDFQPVLTFNAGQYLGVEVKPENSAFIEIRQYSLSRKPNGKDYRISVKREEGEKKGLLSNYLHDHMQVGDIVDLHSPAGDFYFTDKQSPVVLISAGVGVTPMQAMLDVLAHDNYQYPVTYIHACENSTQHSFKDSTNTLCLQHGWQAHTWYNQETSNEQNIHQGFIDLSTINLPRDNGDFYLCGPVGFMKFINEKLRELGVDESRIHYEVFGPFAAL